MTTSHLAREQVISRYWPYDGPHTLDSISSALEAVAELVRTTANATQSPHAVGPAQDGYRALGAMTSATESLPQVFTQLAMWAEHIGADASVRHDQFRGEESREMAREDADEARELLTRSP